MPTPIAKSGIARPTVGFLVNPIAGMGGRVGLKGTDGIEILRVAQRLGARPAASSRALLAIQRLVSIAPSVRILTGPRAMGEYITRSIGFTPEVLGEYTSETPDAADTRRTAQLMTEQSVDLIVFVGGDGTARDVLAAVGDRVPILGVPAGVKMHSAVFGTNPRAAGDLAALFLTRHPTVSLRQTEVMDLDESAIRQDRLSAALYGYAISPFARRLTQNAKSGSRQGAGGEVVAAAREVAHTMIPDCVYLLGPGTTTRHVADELGIGSTLLGVDAVLDRKLLAADIDERTILQLMTGRETWIVVGVLGGQGSLFGRGNQQISSTVINKAGVDHIIALSSMEKLVELGSSPLHVDTGDAVTDANLAGYLRVRTGFGRSSIVEVAD